MRNRFRTFAGATLIASSILLCYYALGDVVLQRESALHDLDYWLFVYVATAISVLGIISALTRYIWTHRRGRRPRPPETRACGMPIGPRHPSPLLAHANAPTDG